MMFFFNLINERLIKLVYRGDGEDVLSRRYFVGHMEYEFEGHLLYHNSMI